jgi:hypothetical protein
MPPTIIVECPCCCCFHRHEFRGDCRDNSERFASLGDAATRLNTPVVEGWESESGSIDATSPDPIYPGDTDN